MKTSIDTFRNDFAEGVLNFIWREWCRVCVVGASGRTDPWAIDPEPLLAFTTEIARHDARVFDEVMDWLVVNGRWINTQRLSTVMQQDNVGDKAVTGAIASWMAGQDKSMKWRGLAQRAMSEVRKPEEPLFQALAGKAPDSPAHADASFRRYGLVRETVRTRGLTRPVNMKDTANIMFKSRAVFGIGMRADVMAYMVMADGAHPRDAARILGYNHMRVQELFVGLADAGIASVQAMGRVRQYRIDRDKWRSVLVGEDASVPRWVNWRAVMRGLTSIWREAWAIDATRADEYIVSSKMRSAMQSARNDLLGSGIEFNIADDKGYVAEAYLPVFMRDARNILKRLND